MANMPCLILFNASEGVNNYGSLINLNRLRTIPAMG